MIVKTKRGLIMRIKILMISAILFISASSTWALGKASADASLQAEQLLVDIKTWDNQRLKQFLSNKITQNQYLLTFLKEFHEQLAVTEHDRAYEYFSKSVIEDQMSLVFISNHLSSVGTIESLDLDEILSKNSMLQAEFDGMLKYNLSLSGSRSLVNRILYYGLMEKYATL